MRKLKQDEFYTYLTINNEGKLEKWYRGEEGKKIGDMSASVLLESSKELEKHLLERVEAGYNVDGITISGSIAYLCESKAAVELLQLQEAMYSVFDDACKEYEKITTKKYKSKEEKETAIAAALDKRTDLYTRVPNEISMILKERFSDSFIPYGYIKLNYMDSFTGSYFKKEEAEIETTKIATTTFAQGTINVENFKKKLELLGYLEGGFPGDVSITNPAELLADRISDHTGTSLVAFTAPYTIRKDANKRAQKRYERSKK